MRLQLTGSPSVAALEEMAAGNQEWVFVSRPQPAGMALSDWELRDCAEPTPIKGEELLCATYVPPLHCPAVSSVLESGWL